MVDNRPPARLIPEVYEGVVEDAHEGKITVIWETATDDVVEHRYDASQFEGGVLPAVGARLRYTARVEEVEDEAEPPVVYLLRYYEFTNDHDLVKWECGVFTDAALMFKTRDDIKRAGKAAFLKKPGLWCWDIFQLNESCFPVETANG